MDKLKITAGIKDIFINFFTNKSTRADSYNAFKAMHYTRVYDLISPQNCKTPEQAHSTMNYLCGMKDNFEQIKLQYELSKQIKK